MSDFGVIQYHMREVGQHLCVQSAFIDLPIS